MPTQRRRIGFLPSSEVQNIIDKICNHNKLSQSKVTGILVEEALSFRGVINTSKDSLSFDFTSDNGDGSLTSSDTFNSKLPNDEGNFNLEDFSIKDEVQMINEFIEFKLFKNIMNSNRKRIKY